MKFFAIFLFCFYLLSCSATGKVDCEGQFTYDTDGFTTEQQEWVENASVRWNEWVGRKIVDVRPGKDSVCHIYNGPTKSATAIGEIQTPAFSIAIYVDRLMSLNILNRVRFESVVMHEIGHALGFRHTSEPGKALMNSRGANDFSEVDRIQCVSLGICEK